MSYELQPEHPLTVACPYFPPEEQARLQAELLDILNGNLSMGLRVGEFEKEFAAYCGASFGVAMPNCSAALEVALMALGVKPGDEVLVPAQTFVATGMAVYLIGARPVFTEISGETFSMDFEDAKNRITERTRGAIVVHFGGLISPAFPSFVAWMKASGRFVIEDAAHAPGAELNGKRAGSLADVGCFSFFPTKIMTTGEGGMLVTSRADVATTARSLQNRGLDMTGEGELYQHPGRNNRLSEIAAAMGLSQLRCLPGFLERRRRIAHFYDEAYRGSERIHPIFASSGSRSSYWRYPVLLQPRLDRRAFRDALRADGIAIDWPYDPPLHLQPVFRNLLQTRPGMLPRAEELMSRHACLPMHARLRDRDAAYVIDRVRHHVAHVSGAG